LTAQLKFPKIQIIYTYIYIKRPIAAVCQASRDSAVIRTNLLSVHATEKLLKRKRKETPGPPALTV
jgi:hypothetical protein